MNYPSRKPLSPVNRSTHMLLLSVVGAAAIIVAIVIATPLPELDYAGDPTVAPGGSLSLGANQGVVPPNTRRVSPESLNLPSNAENIDTAALQEELKAVAEQLLERYPSQPAALHVAAQIYAELKQRHAALEIWQRSIALRPTAPGQYVGFAEVLIASGRDDEAVQVLELARLEVGLTSELVLTLAQARENLGHLTEAEAILVSGIDEFDNDSGLWLALGRVRNQLGKFEQAESNLRYAIEMGGATEAALFTLATALTRQGKPSEAAETRKELEVLRASQNERDQEFQQKYDSAMRRIAHRLLLAAASIEQEHDKLEDAEKLTRRALALVPDGLQAYMVLAGIYRQQSKLAEALAVHQVLLDKQPDNLLNYINLASLAMVAGDMQLAETTLIRAQRLDAEEPLVKVALAKLYLAMEKFSEARQLAVQVSESNPSVEAYLLLAAAYEGAGDGAAARAALEKAQDIDPQHPLLDKAQGRR